MISVIPAIERMTIVENQAEERLVLFGDHLTARGGRGGILGKCHGRQASAGEQHDEQRDPRLGESEARHGTNPFSAFWHGLSQAERCGELREAIENRFEQASGGRSLPIAWPSQLHYQPRASPITLANTAGTGADLTVSRA
jgi:hypothetical protein